MSGNNIILTVVCVAGPIIWAIIGALFMQDFESPKNNKQVFVIMALLGPIGIIVVLVAFVYYLIKNIYEKMGE